MTRSRMMLWVGHVARIGYIRKSYKIFAENRTERGLLKLLVVDGKIILKLISRKYFGCGLDSPGTE
jgi:hypothetical protein